MAGFNHIENDTATGMVGGTLLAILVQLDGSDIIRTLILASLGAVVSFVVSHLCKWSWIRLRTALKEKKNARRNFSKRQQSGSKS